MKLENDIIEQFDLQPVEQKHNGRSREYYRNKRKKAINKKYFILKHIYLYDEYTCKGKLSKGKVHCSCWMCTEKVSNLGWTQRDKKQFLKESDKEEN